MKIAFFLVSILAAEIAAGIPFTPEMEKMGVKRLPVLPQSLKQGFDPNNYVILESTVNWDEGDLMCEDMIPNVTLHLLTIETEAELNFLNVHFYNGTEEGGEFWTSGRNDMNSPTFLVWDSNGEPVPGAGTWAPWAANHPPPLPNPNQRVTFHPTLQGDSTWRIRNKGEVFLSIICELTVQSEPVPCERTNDIIIYLDSSSSVTQPHFSIGLNFVQKLVSSILHYEGSRVGFSAFSTAIREIIPLNNNLTPDEIYSAINNTFYDEGSTNTHLALLDAISKYSLHSRPDVPRNIITITDGGSNDPELTKQAALAAKDAGLNMLSVGINGFVWDEILILAGNDTQRAFTATDFNELMNLLYPVSLKACA